MKLIDVITAAGGRVSGGDPHLWECFGPNAQYMEFRDFDGNGVSHCIFDTFTYEVYFVHCELPLVSNEAGVPHQAFCWYEPSYRTAYMKECVEHEVDPNIAYDDVKYTEVFEEKTILKYLKDIGDTNYEDLPPPNVEMVLDAPGTFGGAKIVWPSDNS